MLKITIIIEDTYAESGKCVKKWQVERETNTHGKGVGLKLGMETLDVAMFMSQMQDGA